MQRMIFYCILISSEIRSSISTFSATIMLLSLLWQHIISYKNTKLKVAASYHWHVALWQLGIFSVFLICISCGLISLALMNVLEPIFELLPHFIGMFYNLSRCFSFYGLSFVAASYHWHVPFELVQRLIVQKNISSCYLISSAGCSGKKMVKAHITMDYGIMNCNLISSACCSMNRIAKNTRWTEPVLPPHIISMLLCEIRLPLSIFHWMFHLIGNL